MTHADDSTIASSVDGLSLDDTRNKFAKHAARCTSEENCGCNNHSDEGEEEEEKGREEVKSEGDRDESCVLETKGGGGEGKASKRSRGEGGKEKMPGIQNKALQNIDDCTKGLMISQMRDVTVSVEGSEGLMPMLQSCLESDLERFSVVVISGVIEHFESKKDVDMGWGCGWRNIQMMCSYLLSEDTELREVLFGSAGFVPDIPALQMWLEIAWGKGFDVAGGEYFNWNIRGTNKWIGTTEGAALLRSFGARAQIVDFQATGGKRGSGDMRSKTGQQTKPETAAETDMGDGDGDGHGDVDESQSRNGNPSEDEQDNEKGAEAEHDETQNSNPNSEPPSGGKHGREPSEVECAVCGEHQLKDSQIRRDLWHADDVCPTCSQNSPQTCQDSNTQPWKQDEKASDGEHDRQISGHQRGGWDKKTGSGGSEEGSLTVKHRQMVDWIWSYFTGEILDQRQGEEPDSTVILSQRSPLYVQHRGHSQTIIGIERRRKSSPPVDENDKDDHDLDNDDTYLLVLDPSQPTKRILQSLQEKQGWKKLIKRGLRTLKQTEYQLCYIDRGVAKGEEYENLKTLTSHSYTY